MTSKPHKNPGGDVVSTEAPEPRHDNPPGVISREFITNLSMFSGPSRDAALADLDGLLGRHTTLRDEINDWLNRYQNEGLDAAGALDGISEALGG